MKPRAVCQPCLEDPMRQLYWESSLFASACATHGLVCRAATRDDRTRLYAFLLTLWDEMDMEPLHELERTLRHDFSLILTDAAGVVVGAQLAQLYADHTLQCLRYGLAPAYRGLRLGVGLVRRHAMDAMLEHGARVRRGTVEVTNVPSMVNLLNQVGCVATEYEPLPLHDPPALAVTLDLTPYGLVANRIDQAAAVAWSQSRADTMVIDPKDTGLLALLESIKNHVIGVLPTGQLLATPCP